MKQRKHLVASDITASISTSPPTSSTTTAMPASFPRLLTSITVAACIAMAIALTPTTMVVEASPQAVTGPIREESAAAILLSCTEWPNSPECLNATVATGSPAELLQRNASWPPLDNLLEMDLEMDPDNNWPLERVVSTIVPVFFGIIGLAGLLGNALVILVVVANQQMRSTTNLLIINLAISDILFVIFCVPFTATDYVLPTWPFGSVLCKFVQYMIVVTCHCSVYTLVLMSFDRFLAVVHPVSSISLRTERNALLAILLAWVLIVTTAIPVALCHTVRIYKYRGSDYTACVFNSEEDTWSLVGFQVSFFLSSYVAPLTLISFLYMGMLARLWKTAPGCKPSAESRKGKRRVTRMVVVVVLAFAICWLPIHVILLLKALGYYGSTETTVIIQIISHVLAYTNSCINPILYAFLSDNFRKAFRKIVWCGSTPLIVTNQQITKTTRTTGNGTSNIDML